MPQVRFAAHPQPSLCTRQGYRWDVTGLDSSNGSGLSVVQLGQWSSVTTTPLFFRFCPTPVLYSCQDAGDVGRASSWWGRSDSGTASGGIHF